MMYVSMIFSAAFIGYSIGVSPIISFHSGAENYQEVKSLLGKSLKILLVGGFLMLGASELLALPLSMIFVSYNQELLDITVHGFRIFSVAFPFMGFAIFGSGFFTALNDGLTSAAISFLRTLVFQMGAVLLLPHLCGPDGIWMSVVVAEAMAVLLCAVFLFTKRKKYHYL